VNEARAGEGEAVLDLTGDPPVPPGSALPLERDYDPEPEREKVRGRIAQGLTLAVAVIAIMAFALVAWGSPTADQLERLQVFFTPVITLCGTALGFYFGGKQSK
jgi:hypothetical protein